MACPICQSNHFYVKDPEDEFEIYECKCQDGQIQYEDDDAEDDAPKMSDNPEIYCQRCAWHGKIEKM